MEVGKKGKVHVEDIVFLIRKDPKKYARVKVSNSSVIITELLHCTFRIDQENVLFLIYEFIGEEN